MGVMLTSGGPRGRIRRRGQHTRTPDEQACLDAFAAFLRYDAPGAGRSLSRLAAPVLAERLLPAARALADAVGLVLAEQPRQPGFPASAAGSAGAGSVSAAVPAVGSAGASWLAAGSVRIGAAGAGPLAAGSAPIGAPGAGSPAAGFPVADFLAAGSPAAGSPAGFAAAGRAAAGRRQVQLDFTVSPDCLLGMCRAGGRGCTSAACEHSCHTRPG